MERISRARSARHSTLGMREVRSHFERAAGSFDRLYSETDQPGFMRWINRQFRSDIAGRYILTLDHARESGAESVLDVGCGSGRYLVGMARQGVKRLVGIDLSQPMLDLAAGQLEEPAHPSVDLICADFGEFQTEERFDLVVAMGFFDYQEEPIRQLTKMRSLSKRSVVASFPSRHWFRTPVRKFRYHLKRCPVYFYDPHEIAGLAAEAGFDMVRTIKLPGAGMDYVAILSQTGVTNPRRHFSATAVSPGVERQSAGIQR